MSSSSEQLNKTPQNAQQIQSARKLAGFGFLGVVIFIFVFSSYVNQLLYKDYDYNKPLFVMFFNTCCGMIMVLKPQTLKKVLANKSLFYSTEITVKNVAILSTPYMCMQLCDKFALQSIALTTNMCLNSTQSVFTMIVSMIMFRQKFRFVSALGVAGTVVGVLVAIICGKSINIKNAITQTVWGQILTLASALSYGIYTNLVKKQIKKDEDMDLMMFFFGFIALILAVPVLGIAHATEFELFQAPGQFELMVMFLNAIIGSVLAVYFLCLQIVRLNPLIVSIGLGCTTPFAFIAEQFILKEHAFNQYFALGAVITIASVTVVSLDQHQAGKEAERDQAVEAKAKQLDTTV